MTLIYRKHVNLPGPSPSENEYRQPISTSLHILGRGNNNDWKPDIGRGHKQKMSLIIVYGIGHGHESIEGKVDAPFECDLSPGEQIHIKESLTRVWRPLELLPFHRLTTTKIYYFKYEHTITQVSRSRDPAMESYSLPRFLHHGILPLGHTEICESLAITCESPVRK